MAIIYSPNKNYTGITASVSFINGKGETNNPWLIQWFKTHNYIVKEELEEKEDKENKGSEENTEKLLKENLKVKNKK